MAFISTDEKRLYGILDVIGCNYIKNPLFWCSEEQRPCYSALVTIKKGEYFSILLIQVESKSKKKDEIEISNYRAALKIYLEGAKQLGGYYLALAYDDRDNMEIIVKEMLKLVEKADKSKYRVSNTKLASYYGLDESSIISTSEIVRITKRITEDEKRQICMVDDYKDGQSSGISTSETALSTSPRSSPPSEKKEQDVINTSDIAAPRSICLLM